MFGLVCQGMDLGGFEPVLSLQLHELVKQQGQQGQQDSKASKASKAANQLVKLVNWSS
jgi:hypothetical protein